MTTHYLIKKKTHSFLTQQLNIFYPLKDSGSLLFSKFPLESLNPSRSFLECVIIFTSYFLPHFCLFPGILEFWCLVTATFKFSVLYNSIYRKKNTYFNETVARLVPRKSISKKELTSLIDSYNDKENVQLRPVT